MMSTVLRRTVDHETIRVVAKDTSTIPTKIAGVCTWFAENARPLPWRDTSPWGVMVSEFMLQQTPVTRVEPVWRAWLDRWPTPSSLAADSSGNAVRAWGRLGYPRRALRLHAASLIITEHHDGEVPLHEADLRALPGIGQYTAAAIVAFAFGRPAVVLDVNVRRVLARAWRGLEGPSPHLTATERALAAALAQEAASPAAWAAASMELGAVVCTKRKPNCLACPLQGSCSWRQAGYPSTGLSQPRQARFEGSDRQARGRILAALRDTEEAIGKKRLLAGAPDAAQAQRALASLIDDGLVIQKGRGYTLPA